MSLAASLIRSMQVGNHRRIYWTLGEHGPYCAHIPLDMDPDAYVQAEAAKWAASAAELPVVSREDEFRQTVKDTPSEVVKAVLAIDDAKLAEIIQGVGKDGK